MDKKYCADMGIQYYEIANALPPLVLLHAQGVDAKSFEKVAKKLSKTYHVFALDCYGHGGSLHNAELYTVEKCGEAVIHFIKDVIGDNVYLLGHSSGGLIAAYVAANSDVCEKLILEDAPFFASQGDRRTSTFHYVDLSTVCHTYLQDEDADDFVAYYFKHQYAWNFFPESNREDLRKKLTRSAVKFRIKHPEKNLKVPFWPKNALAGFCGMQNYDPEFGEAFYTDSFHANILHEKILRKISCQTLFLKARTNETNGILSAALSDADLEKVVAAIPNCKVVRLNCGHGIHTEQPKAFLENILDFLA